MFFRRKTEQKVEPQIAAKASRAMSINMVESPRARWSLGEVSQEKLAREGYMLNVVANSAINRIAVAVSNIQWDAWRGDKRLDSHPFVDLLKRPNPMQSGYAFWRATTASALIYGNAYTERVFGASRQTVRELWNIRADRMLVEPGTGGIPRAYIYKVGQAEKRFPVKPMSAESDIHHTKLFHPLDDNYGLSPLIPGAYATDQHTEAMTWAQALLQNSARPSGALVVDSETTLSDEEVKRLKAEIENIFSGSKNAGRPMLLEGGMDWKQMGLSPMDMEVMKTLESAARHIALAFGVPPLLLNIPGDNTYSNYREARLGFYEDTILPFVNYVVADFNKWLGPYFQDVELKPNLAAIEALAEKRLRMWEMADNSDDITLNESREMKGLPPLAAPLGDMLMADVRKYGSEGKPDEPVFGDDPDEEGMSLVYGR